MAFQLTTLAQYGEAIPTVKDRESVVVRHNLVNGREQVEIKARWSNGEEEGDVWLKNNFGRSQPLALCFDSEEAIDDLIAALEAAKADFTETPKSPAAKAEAKAGPVPVKPVVRSRDVKAKARAARSAKAS